MTSQQSWFPVFTWNSMNSATWNNPTRPIISVEIIRTRELSHWRHAIRCSYQSEHCSLSGVVQYPVECSVHWAPYRFHAPVELFHRFHPNTDSVHWLALRGLWRQMSVEINATSMEQLPVSLHGIHVVSPCGSLIAQAGLKLASTADGFFPVTGDLSLCVFINYNYSAIWYETCLYRLSISLGDQ